MFWWTIGYTDFRAWKKYEKRHVLFKGENYSESHCRVWDRLIKVLPFNFWCKDLGVLWFVVVQNWKGMRHLYLSVQHSHTALVGIMYQSWQYLVQSNTFLSASHWIKTTCTALFTLRQEKKVPTLDQKLNGKNSSKKTVISF